MLENDTMLSRSGRKTEIRFEVEADECSVMDGYCSATGCARTDLLKKLLRKWSAAKHEEATVILRVAGVNPTRPGGGRSE